MNSYRTNSFLSHVQPILGPDEYFYQRPSGNHPPASTPSPTSRRFYLAPDEPRMGEPDEFEKMAREYDEQHPQ